MNRQRILIVEDDRALARVLSDNLSFSGFDVDWVDDGAEVLNKVRSTSPDLVLLDLMLPGRDGFNLCGLIRQGGRTPVIMLTARDQKVDKVRGLELGADDYITKPFDFEELQARIRAVLRRARRSATRINIGEAIIDFVAFTATRAGLDLPCRGGSSICSDTSRNARAGSCNAMSCCAKSGDSPRNRQPGPWITRFDGCEESWNPIRTTPAIFTPCMATATR